jgi:crossover junction endodeoxyribonuclease RusA
MDRPTLSMNQRLHWAEVARRKRLVGDQVLLLARAARLPRGLSRVEVVLHWRPTIRRRRDSDNPSPTLKAAIDGLAAYGLVPDDDALHVRSYCEIHPVGKPGRVWLAIKELLDGEAS